MDIQQIIYAIGLVALNSFLISKFIDTSINAIKFAGVIIFYYFLILLGSYLGSMYLNNELVGSIAGMIVSVYLWINFGSALSKN